MSEWSPRLGGRTFAVSALGRRFGDRQSSPLPTLARLGTPSPWHRTVLVANGYPRGPKRLLVCAVIRETVRTRGNVLRGSQPRPPTRTECWRELGSLTRRYEVDRPKRIRRTPLLTCWSSRRTGSATRLGQTLFRGVNRAPTGESGCCGIRPASLRPGEVAWPGRPAAAQGRARR